MRAIRWKKIGTGQAAGSTVKIFYTEVENTRGIKGWHSGLKPQELRYKVDEAPHRLIHTLSSSSSGRHTPVLEQKRANANIWHPAVSRRSRGAGENIFIHPDYPAEGKNSF